VPQRRHPTDIVIERNTTEPPPELVGGALAEIGHKMGGVGRAAPIAEDKDLTILLQGLPEQIDQLRHRLGTDRAEGRVLRLQIVSNPLLHAVSIAAAPCEA